MIPTILLYIIIFIFGIVIGSFLNVCIYRIPKKEDIVKNSILPLQAWINNYNKNSDIYIEALSFTKKLLLSFTNEE